MRHGLATRTIRRCATALTVAALTATVWAAPALGARPAPPTCSVSQGVVFASSRGTVTITGTAGDDIIDCRSNQNAKTPFRIDGSGGADLILGGPEVDSVFVRAGRSEVHGGLGDDLLIAAGGTGLFYGNAGADLITLVSAGDGISTADGGDGNDMLEGSPFRDLLVGGAGADRLNGNAGDDEIRGGSGLDLMTGGDGADVLGDDGPDADGFNGGVGTDSCLDGDGHGTGTDGSVGYLGSIQNDQLASCDEVSVAISAPV